MFCTFEAAGRNAFVNGVTPSSSAVSMFTYFTPGWVGAWLRLVRNDEPWICWTQAAQVADSAALVRPARPRLVISVSTPSSVVPKLDGARPTSMLTLDAPP